MMLLFLAGVRPALVQGTACPFTGLDTAFTAAECSMVPGMHGRQLGGCHPNLFKRGFRREQLLGESLGVSGIGANSGETECRETHIHAPSTKACTSDTFIGMSEISMRAMDVRAFSDGQMKLT